MCACRAGFTGPGREYPCPNVRVIDGSHIGLCLHKRVHLPLCVTPSTCFTPLCPSFCPFHPLTRTVALWFERFELAPVPLTNISYAPLSPEPFFSVPLVQDLLFVGNLYRSSSVRVVITFVILPGYGQDCLDCQRPHIPYCSRNYLYLPLHHSYSKSTCN